VANNKKCLNIALKYSVLKRNYSEEQLAIRQKMENFTVLGPEIYWSVCTSLVAVRVKGQSSLVRTEIARRK
jgi:hypothetical protein